MAAVTEGIDRRRLRRDSLAAQHADVVALLVVEDRREVAARAVQVWLDDLQREAGRDGRIECVPAALEHRHAGGRRQPVCRRDHSEGAAQLWARGELDHRPHPRGADEGALAQAGLMFWFTWKTLSGSYLPLISASRS